MYKKIFSAILFGALTLASTSTFVSCKDYDDDIENLQAQIDDLVNQKVATLETTVNTLQTQLTALDAAYKEGDQQTLAAAKALIEEAIADCQKACKENLAASQATQDAKYDEAITKVNQRVDDVLKLLSDADGNIQQVGKDLKALSEKLAAFESEFGSLSTAFRELTQKVTNLEDAVKANKAAIDDLAKTIGTGTGSNGYDDTTLKSDIAQAGTRIDELEKKIAALREDLTNKINEEIAAVNTKIGNVATDLETLKTEHANFATQVTNSITELRTGLSEVKAQAQQLASEVNGLEVMLTILSSDLRSLVYMPKLYIDGIESIEYPYLAYERLTKKTIAATRQERDDDIPMTFTGLEDYVNTPLDSAAFGPVWPIQYHMNPGNSAVGFDDLKGFYAYSAEVMTRAFFDTKTNNAGTWGIVPADRWDDQYENNAVSNMIWGKKEGIMTVGLRVKNIKDLDDFNNNHKSYFPSDVEEDAKDPYSVDNVILAIQAKAHKYGSSEIDTTITSDYAQLVPEKVKIEGMIWKDSPKYWREQNERIKDFWENKKGYGDPTWTPLLVQYNDGTMHPYTYRKGTPTDEVNGRDEEGKICGKWVHVWDTPAEALTHPADIEVYIDQEVVLSKYLGVHWYFEQNEPLTDNVVAHKNIQTWKFDDKELRRYGFVWVFDTVDYVVDTNKTHDSRYMRFTNHKTGALVSANITEVGATYEDVTHTSVGREPLVRVRLLHFSDISDMNKWQNIDQAGGINAFNALNAKPVLDGYIRLHITRPEKIEITYPTESFKFNLCDGATTKKYGRENYWDYARFSKTVLTDSLKNLEKEQFDALYKIELANGSSAPTGTNRDVEVAQYVKAGSPNAESPNEYYYYKNVTGIAFDNTNWSAVQIGQIFTEENVDGVSNHTYWWKIPAEQLEALTHHAGTPDAGSAPITITRYIHYTGHFYSSSIDHSEGAKYDDIFIKLSLTISREDVMTSETSKKDENYWYKLDNSLNNWFKIRTNEALWSVANNTEYPQDGGSTIPWVNDITKNWDQNKVNVTNTGAQSYDLGNGKYGKPSKFYFAPFTLEFKIEKLDGTTKTYYVTPKRGKNDIYYDKFICKYIKGNRHQYALKPANNQNGYVDQAANNEILNSCAINFGANPYGIEVQLGKHVDEVTEPSAWPWVDGVFSNDTLYAYTDASAEEYEPIAIIQNTNVNAADGGAEVVLLHEYRQNQWLGDAKCISDNNIGQENEFTEEILNAVGRDVDFKRATPSGKLTGEWEDKGNPLAKQLRSYVGVIATKKCNIANQMKDANPAIDNFSVFQMPWERPVNIVTDVDIMIDAHDNADYIYMVDIIRLYDWRGLDNTVDNEFDKGYMWGDTPDFLGQSWGKRQWLWAYYNVKEIVIDLSTKHVYTNLSLTDDTTIESQNIKADWPTLSQISNKVLLSGPNAAYDNSDKKYHMKFDLRSPIDFNKLSMNQDLIDYMGIARPWQETIDNVKAKFGYIKYENNGQNLHDFDIAVPISVRYDWGWIEDRLVRIHIYGTLGNH